MLGDVGQIHSNDERHVIAPLQPLVGFTDPGCTVAQPGNRREGVFDVIRLGRIPLSIECWLRL